MTDDTPLDPRDEDDLLAAEYVLGLLGPDDWRRAQERAAVDGDFAAKVQAWENRLSPLNEYFPEEPAPDLLDQIEARLFPPAPAPARRGWLWGAGLGTAIAAVLALVVFVAFPPAPPPAPTLQAELVDAERGLTLLVGVIPQEEAVTISATGPTPEAGSVYELWAIDEGGAPRSLGLLDGGETRLSGVVQPGETIAVSLEPEGGSPEPAPTGPVLATALLTAP